MQYSFEGMCAGTTLPKIATLFHRLDFHTSYGGREKRKTTELLTVAASTSIPDTLRLAVKGILRDFISFCQFPIIMSRNSWLKGPE